MKDRQTDRQTSTIKLQPQIALHYYCNHGSSRYKPQPQPNHKMINKEKLSLKLQPTSDDCEDDDDDDARAHQSAEWKLLHEESMLLLLLMEFLM